MSAAFAVEHFFDEGQDFEHEGRIWRWAANAACKDERVKGLSSLFDGHWVASAQKNRIVRVFPPRSPQWTDHLGRPRTTWFVTVHAASKLLPWIAQELSKLTSKRAAFDLAESWLVDPKDTD